MHRGEAKIKKCCKMKARLEKGNMRARATQATKNAGKEIHPGLPLVFTTGNN